MLVNVACLARMLMFVCVTLSLGMFKIHPNLETCAGVISDVSVGKMFADADGRIIPDSCVFRPK